MAKPEPQRTSYTLTEACQRLGLTPRHIVSVAFDGRLEPDEAGRLSFASVERFAAARARALAASAEVG